MARGLTGRALGARQVPLDRECAIKVLRRHGSAVAEQRFLREARLLRSDRSRRSGRIVSSRVSS
ncbi:MAG TPA: hypothetical protein VKE22_13405 [Haliangiales bacterium]|nr:hypothetical protein [Haliangiales bacterium]